MLCLFHHQTKVTKTMCSLHYGSSQSFNMFFDCYPDELSLVYLAEMLLVCSLKSFLERIQKIICNNLVSQSLNA